MGWNPDIDFSDTAGLSPVEVLQDIVNALNERCKACRIAPLEPFWYGFTIDNPWDEDSYADFGVDLDSLYDVMAGIHYKINALIPLYADHTTATGDEFVDVSSIPAWTEANMLTAIGDPERYDDPDPTFIYGSRAGYRASGAPLSSEWVHQQYKILNNLKWVRYEYGNNFGDNFYRTATWNDPEFIAEDKKKLRFRSTWAVLEFDWLSATWQVSGSASPRVYHVGSYFVPDEPDPYTAESRKGVHVRYYTNLSTVNHEADLYTKGGALPSDSESAWQFDGQGVFSSPDVWARILAHSPAQIGTNFFDTRTFLDSLGTPPEPDIEYFDSENGVPNEEYSGAVTSITVDYPFDPGNFYSTGTLYFFNTTTFQTDNLDWTAVSGSGTQRTFTVDGTLSATYPVGEATIDCISDELKDPPFTTAVYKGFLSKEDYICILRFDVTGGFDYLA